MGKRTICKFLLGGTRTGVVHILCSILDVFVHAWYTTGWPHYKLGYTREWGSLGVERYIREGPHHQSLYCGEKVESQVCSFPSPCQDWKIHLCSRKILKEIRENYFVLKPRCRAQGKAPLEQILKHQGIEKKLLGLQQTWGFGAQEPQFVLLYAGRTGLMMNLFIFTWNHTKRSTTPIVLLYLGLE